MKLEPLSAAHDREDFDCGAEALNHCLQRIARQHEAAGGIRMTAMPAGMNDLAMVGGTLVAVAPRLTVAHTLVPLPALALEIVSVQLIWSPTADTLAKMLIEQLPLAGTVPLVKLTLDPPVATVPEQPVPENRGGAETGPELVAFKILAES